MGWAHCRACTSLIEMGSCSCGPLSRRTLAPIADRDRVFL